MKKIKLNILTMILLSFIMLSCQTNRNEPHNIAQKLRLELPLFDETGWDDRPKGWNTAITPKAKLGFINAVGPELLRYRQELLKISSWDQVPIWHRSGLIMQTANSITKYHLGLHLYIPQGPIIGTVLMTHGYLIHAGAFSWAIDQFTQKGYAVVGIDLPGHGISTGPRADIPDMQDYGDAMITVYQWLAKNENLLPRPWYHLAHSLGGASVIDALSRHPAVKPDKVVLLSPLIRSKMYNLSQFAYFTVGWAIAELPPRFSWDGYLGATYFPTHWFQALQNWIPKITKRPPFDFEYGLVLQGTNDDVVEADTNIPFLKTLLLNGMFVMVPDGDHYLLLSKEERESTLFIIEYFIYK